MGNTALNGPAICLTLRNGFWYAGKEKFKDYRQALRATLRAAHFIPEKQKSRKKGSSKRTLSPPERLEDRPWWPVFLHERTRRHQLLEWLKQQRVDSEARRAGR